MNVMIIDDDENVRKRLKSLIDWEGLSAQLVCEARDSDTARELFLLHRPKIVITDINIPVISGLDLAEEFQKDDSEVRFIVITGYNDFEMARQAFNLRTVNLLSKPIQADVINESIRKAMNQIMEARKNSISMAALQQLVTNNFPQIQQNYMENLLHGRNNQPQQVREKLRQLKIPCPGPNYVVVLISLSVSNETEADRETITLLIRDLFVEEAGAKGLTAYAFTDSHMRVNCLVSAETENPNDVLEEIEKTLRKQIKMIRGAYLPDKTQMLRNFLLEYVIKVTDTALLLGLDINKGMQISAVFTHLFKAQNFEQCIREILALTSSLIEQIQEKRISSTNQIIEQAKGHIRENLHDEHLSLEQVSARVALSKIYFCKLFHRTVGMSFVNYLKQERIELAKKLLLNDDLKVFEISVATGFSSPKYFSYVFKQLVGMTPMEFKKKEKI